MITIMHNVTLSEQYLSVCLMTMTAYYAI